MNPFYENMKLHCINAHIFIFLEKEHIGDVSYLYFDLSCVPLFEHYDHSVKESFRDPSPQKSVLARHKRIPPTQFRKVILYFAVAFLGRR